MSLVGFLKSIILNAVKYVCLFFIIFFGAFYIMFEAIGSIFRVIMVGFAYISATAQRKLT